MPRPVKRATAVLAPIAILLASPAPALAAAKPAAGAAIGQVIIATVGAIIFTAVLLGLVIGLDDDGHLGASVCTPADLSDKCRLPSAWRAVDQR